MTGKPTWTETKDPLRRELRDAEGNVLATINRDGHRHQFFWESGGTCGTCFRLIEAMRDAEAALSQSEN